MVHGAGREWVTSTRVISMAGFGCRIRRELEGYINRGIHKYDKGWMQSIQQCTLEGGSKGRQSEWKSEVKSS